MLIGLINAAIRGGVWSQDVEPVGPHPETIVKYADGSEASYDIVGTIYSWTTIPNKSSITYIDIGTDVTSIGWAAFQGCTNIVEVILPDTLESIDNNSFFNCTSLKHVQIPQIAVDNFRFIFSGYSDLTVDISEGTTTVEPWAFHSCSNLVKITLASTITSIGSSAFESCTGLTCLELNDGLEIIDYGAFMKCSALPSLTIPSSVTSITNATFQGCTGLTSVIFEGKTLAQVKAMPSYPWGISDTSIITVTP